MSYTNNEAQNFYLNCPYVEKNECKALGGWWDRDQKKWFVPKHLDPKLFIKWWPVTKKMEDDKSITAETLVTSDGAYNFIPYPETHHDVIKTTLHPGEDFGIPEYEDGYPRPGWI